MKKMIMDEINQINHLEERVVFKELMNSVFLSLYENNQEMYERLEKRVFDEIAYDSNQYSIVTGLIERRYFDASHHIFSPMLERDMEAESYNLEAILMALQNKEEIKVMQVFLECDYLKVQKILSEGRRFSGYIKTEKGTYRAEFCARKNTDYIDELQHLYHLFMKNGIPWQTVNAPYIAKIANVVLLSCEATLEDDVEITEVSIDFQEFNQEIKYGMVPIWNIEKKETTGIGFPMPCEDHKTYEHAVTVKGLGEECTCLVENAETIIEHVQQVEDKLVITCEAEDVLIWSVYVIQHKTPKKIDTYTYPVVGNQKINSFAEKLNQKHGMPIKTKGELIRFIEGIGLSDYLTFASYEITRNRVEPAETYSMNEFIIDEIRESDNEVNYQKSFIINMKEVQKGVFISRDMLSYIVSEVQLLYPEYNCEGRLL